MNAANRIIAAGTALLLGLAFQAAQAAPSGTPIRIGSTLALTGPLSGTAIIHKLTGEIYVEQLNKNTGCSGVRLNGY